MLCLMVTSKWLIWIFKLRISADDQFIKELMEKIFIWIFIFQLKNGDLGKVYIIW